MFDFDPLLFFEAAVPGSVLGYVTCVCEKCGFSYKSDYEDEAELYFCSLCGQPNSPV